MKSRLVLIADYGVLLGVMNCGEASQGESQKGGDCEGDHGSGVVGASLGGEGVVFLGRIYPIRQKWAIGDTPQFRLG